MPAALEVYVEAGTKRVFAGAVEWPGWCRGARDEEDALQALVDYRDRYAAALGSASRGLPRPRTPAELRVVQRLKGNATTDFGAPDTAPDADGRALDAADVKRQIKLWRASQAAFGAAAVAGKGKALAKGPRGGGRELDAIVAHVFNADRAYLRLIGGRFPHTDERDVPRAMPDLHEAIVGALAARVAGEPPAHPLRTGRSWPPRYFVRRSAWHALDHAWEIEDRAAG